MPKTLHKSTFYETKKSLLRANGDNKSDPTKHIGFLQNPSVQCSVQSSPKNDCKVASLEVCVGNSEKLQGHRKEFQTLSA